MYKLVVVAGKMRGEEFVLEEGENTLGRSEDCSVYFPVPGVSKKHLSITVSKDSAYIKDLGSSNGTFLNGKIIKRATAKTGDKIALPDSILQVVYVEEKKKIIHKKAQQADDDDETEEEFYSGGEPPDHIPGKIQHAFKYKFMPLLHGINEEYEWRHLFAILLTVASLITITLTIIPVLRDNRTLLLEEIERRGIYYADEIARTNSRALEQKELNQIVVNFLDDKRTGVKSYELFDSEGRIYRPTEKLNEYIEDPFSIQTREWAMNANKSSENVYTKSLDNGEIGIGRKITAYNPRLGSSETVGIVAFRFIPESLQLERVRAQRSYLESLVKSILVAVFLFAIVYYLTLRPIEEMRYQIEEALRGRRRNLESKYLMGELSPLRNSINSLLQRLRELQDNDDSEFAEVESDEGYVASLKEFMMGSGVPTVILDSEKNIGHVSTDAEDITGIRENASQGMNILDVSREKGFAATLIELCDESANNGGTFQEGYYELGGNNFKICVTSLIGKDNFAKAFYVTFIRE